jgi:1-deoxy-D-xylulose-5-phosphate reductoisomerase
VPRLDLASVGQLDFEGPDLEAFPCLELAFRAGRSGGTQPAVLNAANEVAVEAFLNGEIGFGSIATVVGGALAASEPGPLNSWSDIDEADSQGRRLATVEMMKLSGAST